MKHKRRISLVILIILLLVGGGVVFGLHYQRTIKPVKQSATSAAPAKSTTQAAQPAMAPSFNKSQYSVTDPSSIWVVVNKQHPLQPIDYAPADLVAVGNGQYMRAEAATALKSMLAGAASAGYTVTAASGYRSYATQVSVYAAEVKEYGQATADTESARPGYSEHQTGWAMDLASDGCSITDCFGTTPGGKWVTAHAYEYGFILRYTAADTDVTGYRAEAWHFRYVGTTLSNELHSQNIATLEQFFSITGGAIYKQ